MSVPVLTFFNNKGGVGKTSLVFHLSWMLSEMGRRVVAIDLDPQANLTSAFLQEETLELLWLSVFEATPRSTIYQCLRPLTEIGDIQRPLVQQINPRLHLVPGDLALAGFEDFLAQEWSKALDSQALLRPFKILSSFWQVAQMAAEDCNADIILADVGPNLGAINRSALIATDHVVIPLAADLFSLQGLRNLGPTLRRWRLEWARRLDNYQQPPFALPAGHMMPTGYILMQHGERLSRPVKAYQKWADRIPQTYAQSVLEEASAVDSTMHDTNRLARLKHYRSLVPMAQELHKPIFALTNADGAIGSHAAAVRDARDDFARLAQAVLDRVGLAAAQTNDAPS